MITVFYDAKCGLCRREIEVYRRMGAPERFSWRDAHEDSSTLLALNVSWKDAMRALHVIDDKGQLQTGVDAFVAIWLGIPSLSWLGHIVSFPLIRPVARWAYQLFGTVRFRLYGYDTCPL